MRYQAETIAKVAQRNFPMGAESHTGIVRAQKPNEDAHLQTTVLRYLPGGEATQLIGLFLVADGMGGHGNGQFASTMIVKTIYALLSADLHNPYLKGESLQHRFLQAVKQANTWLYQENTRRNFCCGTTLTGALLSEQQGMNGSIYHASIINVGDSRTYHYSPGGGFVRITRDHSIVEELINRGVILPEERYTCKRRNEIYRCLGSSAEVDVDLFELTLQAQDRLLLCSDGLWEMVNDPCIAHHLAHPTVSPSEIASRLLQEALNNGGHDNVTAMVVMMPHLQGE